MNMQRGLCCLCVVLFCTTLVVMAVDPVMTHLSEKDRPPQMKTSLRAVPADINTIQGPMRLTSQQYGDKPISARRAPKDWIGSRANTGSRACTPPLCDGAGWTPEGEPTCTDGYNDTFNGGCGSDPVVFSTITCGDAICGESGHFLVGGNNYRDTDWYEIEITTDTKMTVTFRADFDAVFGFIEMEGGAVGCADCAGMSGYIAPAWTPLACEETTVEVCVPGQVACDPNNPTVLQNAKYWFYVSADGFEGVPCGSQYELSLACDTCVVPGCPVGTTLDGQRPNSDVETSSAQVYVSDSQFFYDYGCWTSNSYKRFESFDGISASIDDVHWWGLSRIYDDEMNLVRCPDPNSGVAHGSNCTHFEIQYWAFDDYTNRPDLSAGPLYSQRVTTATPIETELDYWGDLGPVLYWSTVVPSWYDPTNLKGWLSIQHIGEADPNMGWDAEPCQFWWHSSPEGGTIHVGLDERPGDYAEQKDVQGDLAFCLTGTPATLTGACCRATETPPHCYDGVNVANCMEWGDFFNVVDDCATWPNIYCEDLPIAACCVSGTTPCIDDYTFWYCRLVEFGSWHESESCFGTPPFVCPVTVREASNKCPEDADWKQDCANSGYPYPSHNASMPGSGGPRAIDNYTLEPNGPLRIGWYGMDATGTPEDCDFPNPADFIIRFYDGPVPTGPPELPCAIEYSVSAFADETIWAVGPYGTLKYWETYLYSPGPAGSWWWSVQSDNISMDDYECVFWWFEGDQTDDGDGYLWFFGGTGLAQVGGGTDPNQHDTAWCMWTGDTLGWCCHCEDGVCYNEYSSACTGINRTFHTTQSDCQAACAEAEGACCHRGVDPNIPSCEITTESACAHDWLGCYTSCIECCVPPCCPGSVAEGEPTCADEYVDTYNGGCNSDPPVYQDWDMADRICGETGIYQFAGQTYRDTDWYKVDFNLTEVKGIIWRVRGEFYQRNAIYADCAGVGMAPGDTNGDGSVNSLDIDLFVDCIINPNSVYPLMWECVCDMDCNGGINALDIGPFVAALTGSPIPCDCDQPFFSFVPGHDGSPGMCYPDYPALAIVEPGDASYLLFFVSTYTDDDPKPTCGTAYNGSIEYVPAGACTIGGTDCSLRTQPICEALGGVFVDGAQCP